MSHGRGRAWVALLAPFLCAFQADDAFRYDIPSPAFERGAGPTVCFDAAHNNFHTASGAYAPFAQLLRDDGFNTLLLEKPFSELTLAPCSLLAIATPAHADNVEDWSFPHDSAFNREEIRAVHRWVRAGGGLFLVADHSPIPGAFADLAAVFGIAFFDGEARNTTREPLPDVFARNDGTLLAHAISDGRNEREHVSRVATWTGAAFLTSREFQPLLVYGPNARAWAELPETLPELPRSEFPVFEVEGWQAAAAREVGEGRLVILGEAAMCTALADGSGKRGMNTDAGAQNPILCLNSIRWLAGVLS